MNIYQRERNGISLPAHLHTVGAESASSDFWQRYDCNWKKWTFYDNVTKKNLEKLTFLGDTNDIEIVVLRDDNLTHIKNVTKNVKEGWGWHFLHLKNHSSKHFYVFSSSANRHLLSMRQQFIHDKNKIEEKWNVM